MRVLNVETLGWCRQAPTGQILGGLRLPQWSKGSVVGFPGRPNAKGGGQAHMASFPLGLHVLGNADYGVAGFAGMAKNPAWNYEHDSDRF